MHYRILRSCVEKIASLIFLCLLLSHQAFSLDYTVSPDGTGYQAVPAAGGQTITGSKAYEVINEAIQQASAAGGGKVHLVAGTYEVTDFDTITDDNANWVSAKPGVTIETVGSPLPPYQAQGDFVTKITIPVDPQPGLIAHINFDTPIDLSKYPAMAYWLFPNTRIMEKGGVHRFAFTFSRERDGVNPIRTVKVYHPENGDVAIHTQWRGHRLPSYSGNDDEKMFLNDPSLSQLTNIQSIGIELVGVNTSKVNFSDKEVVLYLDDLTAHYGQIEIDKNKGHENVILEGEGPYHTIVKMKDYGNLPMIYLTAKNSEVRYLQIYGNTDNVTLIDYCSAIDAPWAGTGPGADLTGTKIHHNFIHQTQGSSINLRGNNAQVYENLLTHSENPHINASSSQNTILAHNTLKYSTNDAFIYLKYSASFNNQVRNNSFWPITLESRNSNSPDNPTSYPLRFNNYIKKGIFVEGGTYGHTIKENKFYNMKSTGTSPLAIQLKDATKDILVKDNRFYNSSAGNSGTASERTQFIGNYFENGSLAITNGNNSEIEGNTFIGVSRLDLSGTGHYGGNNYVDSTSSYSLNGNNVGITAVAPVLKDVDAGNSWEWGLVFNGGMEEGRGLFPDGWMSTGSDAYTTHTWTENATEGVHGVKAIRTVVSGLDAGSGSNHIAGWSTRDPIRVFPGEVLTAHAIVKGQGGTEFNAMFFKEDGSACTVPSDTVGVVTTDNVWVRLKKDITIPSDCVKVSLGFYLVGIEGAFTVDEVKLYRKMNFEEIGPSVSLDNASFELFNGVANDSTEDVFNNWSSQTQSPTSMFQAVTDGVEGITALKIHNQQIGTNARASQQVYTLQPETNYFLEFWAKRDPGVAIDEGRVQLVDVYASPKAYLQNDLKTWSSSGGYLQSASVRETTWTRKGINFRTPPASAFSGNVEIRFFNNGSTGLYLDNVRLYRGFGQPSRPRIVAAVTGLTAIASGVGRIDLDWADNSEIDMSHYFVYRSMSQGGPFTKVSTNIVTSSYTDTGLLPSTQYYYVVTGINTSGTESTYSKQASATTQ